MVIHSINKGDKSSERLSHILNLQTNDENLLREAINILIDNKSVDYARQRAANMMEKAWKELDPVLPGGKAKENIA